MQRLVAQLVLLAVLAGLCAPLAAAASLPHACCLRRQQHCHTTQEDGFSSRSCGHECCRFLAVAGAWFAPAAPTGSVKLPPSPLITLHPPAFHAFRARSQQSQRAPPSLI